MGQKRRSQESCAACGAVLAAGAGFCAKCGAGTRRPRKKSGTAGPPGEAIVSRVPAAIVFTLFIVAGFSSLYYQLRERPEPRRAVPGSPTLPGMDGGVGTAALPSDHPTLELPEQIIRLLDELQDAADAAPDDLEAWQRLARGYYRAGLLDPSYHAQAMTALDRVLEIEPDNLEALRMYGNVAHDAREFERAEKYFNRYLELDPTDPGVKTDLASTWLFQGRNADAEREYREVIASSPNFVQAHVNLGIALHAQGKTEEATASFRHAREISTTDDQRARIDQILAASEGRPAAPAPAGGPKAAGSGAGSSATTNAETPFQISAGGLLTGHRIVGPRVTTIDWTSASEAKVKLAGFPMDKMPPVMRNKFKSGMNEQLAAMAEEQGIETPIRIELVDADSGEVMDTLDGKEWVGAFDEEAYE
ncbi:MAG: tetratricopeptide repeat protein [Candidatus Binatia bacterium]